MKKQIWISTVQIAVQADSEAEASDAMTECLTNNLKYHGAIIDWQHANRNSPEVVGEYEIENLEEGEIFSQQKVQEYAALMQQGAFKQTPFDDENFPIEQFQKIKRSDLDPDLLRMLQYRAWFTAGNPGVNEEEQIEKEFFICYDELDFIRQELYNEGSYEAANQADELKKINVSYFHIIDQ